MHDISDKRSTEQPERDGTETDIHSIIHALSHYMKAPITAILGFSSLLEEQMTSFEGADPTGKKLELTEARHYTQRIAWNARLLEKMVNDLVFVSRLQKGHPAPVPTSRMCAEVIASYETRLKERSIKVVVQNGIPPVSVDPEHLRWLLAELLGNAISFSKSPSLIRIGFHNGEYFIRDGGTGIRQNILDRIFLPFFTTHGKNSMSTGTGLYIAKRITEMYGGRIRIESTPGSGTTVFFSFPH